MSDKYSWPPYSFYAPPGVVKVSASALQMARELAETMLVTRPGRPQVILFSWADSRRVRKPSGGPWIELGPGLDFGACGVADVPRDVLQTIDGVEFAVRISRHIYESRPLRLIDTDAASASGLTLR